MKKFTDQFFTFLGFIAMAAILSIFVFFVNPVRFLIYAVIIALVFNYKLFRNFRFEVKKTAEILLFSLGTAYLLITTILSVSPYLASQEFRFSHASWVETNVTAVSQKALWDNGYRRKGNAYADIYYTYNAAGKNLKNSEHEAAKRYYPFWESRESKSLVQEFSEVISKKLDEKTYFAFYDPKNPQNSKFFLSKDLIDFRGSLLYDFVTSLVVLLLFISLLILGSLLLSLKIKETKNKY
jgi:hypothetical protein